MPIRTKLSAIAATSAVLAVAPAAHAALPTASTGGARDITQSSALLKGSINPNGEPTTYYFQYGKTKAYGAQTPSQGPTGPTKASIAVSASVQGLTPATTYHYRLVAVNGSGTKLAGDKTFKTPKTPPSITLSASPSQVVFGRSTTLSGQFTPSPGAAVSGVKVTLQQDPAPFGQDFKAVTSTKTDAAGRFSFAQATGVNTTYRVVAASSPRATSSPVVVVARFRVTMSLSTAHPHSGQRVVFRGTVAPARAGQLVRVQRRVAPGRWRTLRTGVLGPSPSAQLSAYRVAVRIRRSGVYRAYVVGDVANVAGASRTRRIRTH